jgi:hypothetical protein
MKNKVHSQTFMALNFRIPGVQVRSFECCNFVIYRSGPKGGQGDAVLIDLVSIRKVYFAGQLKQFSALTQAHVLNVRCAKDFPPLSPKGLAGP